MSAKSSIISYCLKDNNVIEHLQTDSCPFIYIKTIVGILTHDPSHVRRIYHAQIFCYYCENSPSYNVMGFNLKSYICANCYREFQKSPVQQLSDNKYSVNLRVPDGYSYIIADLNIGSLIIDKTLPYKTFVSALFPRENHYWPDYSCQTCQYYNCKCYAIATEFWHKTLSQNMLLLRGVIGDIDVVRSIFMQIFKVTM